MAFRRLSLIVCSCNNFHSFLKVHSRKQRGVGDVGDVESCGYDDFKETFPNKRGALAETISLLPWLGPKLQKANGPETINDNNLPD